MSDDPFTVSVKKWVDKAHAHSDQALQAIAWAALQRVQELTPVRTGTLRAGWQIVRPGDEMPIAKREEENLAMVLSLRAGDVFLITNPVVYARRIEFGFVGEDSLGRHYHQEGRHMLQQTIAEMPAIAQRAINQLEAV